MRSKAANGTCKQKGEQKKERSMTEQDAKDCRQWWERHLEKEKRKLQSAKSQIELAKQNIALYAKTEKEAREGQANETK